MTVPLVAKKVFEDTAACGFSAVTHAEVYAEGHCWRVEHNIDPPTGLPKVQCWTYVCRNFSADQTDDWRSDVASIEIGVGVAYDPPCAASSKIELTLVLEELDTDGTETWTIDEEVEIASEEDWRRFKEETLSRAIETAEALARKRFDVWSDDETLSSPSSSF